MFMASILNFPRPGQGEFCIIVAQRPIKPYVFVMSVTRFDSIHVTQGPDNGTYSIRAHTNGEAIFNVSTSKTFVYFAP